MILRLLAAAALAVPLALCEVASVPQRPLLAAGQTPQHETDPHGRKLRGRFLHITDIHPDPFYKVYSNTDSEGACHHSKGVAGLYGAETSDCDSPVSLINATFDWIAKNLRDDIDFVVWTGDSARHDNDEKIPRSEQQVLQQNEMLVEKFREVFGKEDGAHLNDYIIPIVPTFGNNDILPHNIFTAGPNKWTKNFARVWHQFIPEEQRHQFDRGGWFYVEVIPNKLAVFSLNTMYFFGSNAAVDGCAASSEPGAEHFQWLRIQLQMLRERGMKAILSGHVPPARSDEKVSWDETCWQKYTLWLRQYRDVIVGSLYGHMNIEHFILQDFSDINWKVASAGLEEDVGVRAELESLHAEWKDATLANTSLEARTHQDFSTANAQDYLISLREQWRRLPTSPAISSLSTRKPKERSPEDKYFGKIGGHWAERFATSMVSASVVPNYFPTLRVIEYNITGMDDHNVPPWSNTQPSQMERNADTNEIDNDDYDDENDEYEDKKEIEGDVQTDKHKKHRKKKEKHRKKPKKPSFTVPQGPSEDAPPGPAYSPQPLSWIGYQQYYANLTYINNDFESSSAPSSSVLTSNSDNEIEKSRWNSGRHHGKKPKRPKPRPRPFRFETEYDTRKEEDVFALHPHQGGLIMRRWIDLASRVGEYKPSKEKRLLSQLEDEAEQDKADAVGGVMDFEDGRAGDSAHGEPVEQRRKKHGKKRKHRRIINKTWYAFVDRATVQTMDSEELHNHFGDEDSDDDE